MKSQPSFIDIGVNLTHDQLLNNLDKVINDMIDANINNAIITSSCIDETYKALEIIDKYPSIFYTTVGFHPHGGGGQSSITINADANHTWMRITFIG